MSAALQILAALCVPALALFLSERFKPAGWLGPVGLCYLFGICVANLKALHADGAVWMQIAEVLVPVSMPLLLFATDLRKWLRVARPMMIGFVLAVVAAVLSSLIHGWLFRERLAEAWQVAGMLVGVYVGGTSNLSVIGLALHAKEETFVLLNASDVVVGGAYLVFLLTVAQKVALLFLPRFPKATDAPVEEAKAGTLLRAERILPVLGSVLTAVAIAGVSAGASFLLFGELSVPVVLLLITTLGVAGSFVRKLRENEGSYELGEYLLLGFCFAIGSLADVRELASAKPDVLLMVAAVQFTAIAIHYGLCALFRVDADTTLITSTATIFGPAFIGPVARKLQNRELVVGGIATALVGFALANYLGISTAYLLKP